MPRGYSLVKGYGTAVADDGALSGRCADHLRLMWQGTLCLAAIEYASDGSDVREHALHERARQRVEQVCRLVDNCGSIRYVTPPLGLEDHELMLWRVSQLLISQCISDQGGQLAEDLLSELPLVWT